MSEDCRRAESTRQQELLTTAERWRSYCGPATSYLFLAAFEPAEATPVARFGSA